MTSQTLSEMQMAFMRALWELGEANVAQVQEQLGQQGQEFAPTTVATVLRRMEKKGWVAHRKEGRQFIYSAAQSRAEMGGSLLSRIAKALYGGDTRALLTQLLDSESVGKDDLQEIKRLITEREAESRGGRRR